MSVATNVAASEGANEKKDGTNKLLAYVSLKDFLTDSNQGYAGYHVATSQIINILLVGRSQAGKSTLLATLLNPQQAVQGRGFSVTKEPQIQAFILSDEHTNIQYTINVIDTPGLREKRIDDLQSRGDEEIIRLAGQCIKSQITYLNIVIYVTVAKRTHELDAEAFKCIRDYLGKEFESSSLLVLSHCEEVPKKRFEQIVNDMKTFPETNEIINYCKLGVLPYGTMNADLLNLCEDEDDDSPEQKEKTLRKVTERVQDAIKRIEKMRQDLFRAIIKTADKPRSISQLEGLMKIIKEKEEETLNAALNAAKVEWNKEKKEDIEKMMATENSRHVAEFDKIKLEFEKFHEQTIAKQEEERKRYEAELAEQNERFLREMKAKQEEEKRLFEAELAKERDLQNKKFLEVMKAKQEEERKLYQDKLAKETAERNKQFNEEMKKHDEEQRKGLHDKLQKEQLKQREEFEKQLTALSEEQRREKARLFAEQQAKEAREREQQIAIELEKTRLERARLFAEQQEKERQEKERRMAIEAEKRLQEQARLHAEQQVREAKEKERKLALSN